MAFMKKYHFISYAPQQSPEFMAVIKKEQLFHCEAYGLMVKVCRLESCRYFQKCQQI